MAMPKRPLPGRAAPDYMLRMSRTLIVIGIILVLIGLLWGPISRSGLGRLPGDIIIEREGFTLYLPITSAIIVSIVISAAFALVRLFLGR